MSWSNPLSYIKIGDIEGFFLFLSYMDTSKSRTYQIVQTMFSTDYTRKNIVGTKGGLAK